MKLLIGSYNQNIYEVEINEREQKFSASEIYLEVSKPSYLINYKDELAFINMEDETQILTIGNKKVSLGSDTACHLSYDQTNSLFYTSHYHAGVLKVIKEINNEFRVIDTYSYGDNAKIHFASYIDNLSLTGVCDLGNDNFHLYEVVTDKLVSKASFAFPKGSGPRHFVHHHNKPIIYVITEHTAEIYVLQYQNEVLTLLHTVSLQQGDASAIRITNDGKFLYGADRKDNSISAYEILSDGFLIPTQVMETFGIHPRDFNISLDEKWVVVANMESNNLSLYSRDRQSGSLILVDKDYPLDSGAVILFR